MYKVCRDFILNLKKNLEIIVKLVKKKISEYNKNYNKNNKDKIREIKANYNKKNKDKISEKRKKFNAQICYDPKSRKKRNKELYKDINLKNCIIES